MGRLFLFRFYGRSNFNSPKIFVFRVAPILIISTAFFTDQPRFDRFQWINYVFASGTLKAKLLWCLLQTTGGPKKTHSIPSKPASQKYISAQTSILISNIEIHVFEPYTDICWKLIQK